VGKWNKEALFLCRICKSVLAGSGTGANSVEGEAEIMRTEIKEERNLEIAGTGGMSSR